jgi:molybdopterin converting factor small subunit
MGVKINIPSYLQPYTNDTAVVEVKGRTLHECLDGLISQFPEIRDKLFDKDSTLHSYVSIYLDGEFTYEDEIEKRVRDGDEFHLFYILGGG